MIESVLTFARLYSDHVMFGMWIVTGALVAWIVFALIRGAARREARFNRVVNSVCIQVIIPKQLDDRGNVLNDPKQIQDQIALAEAIFSNLGSVKPESGVKAWWRGRQDQLSLEMVAKDRLLHFYWVIPYEWQLFIEQQIHAQYPSAEIQTIADYNIFKEHAFAVGTEFGLGKDYIFPIKTFPKFDVDPASAILTSMSRLSETESAAVQLVVRSARKNWNDRAKKVAKRVGEGNSLDHSLKEAGISIDVGGAATSVYNNLDFAMRQVVGGTPNAIDNAEKSETRETVTQQEQETIKGIEEKATKAGFQVNMRVVAVADTKERAEKTLANIKNAFGVYNIFQYGNGFVTKETKSATVLDRYVFRDFTDKKFIRLNSEEVASVYHFPVASNDVPNIVWLLSKKAPAPTNTPTEGTKLGFNEFRGRKVDVHIKPLDRFRHLYTIGKSGSGKSTLLVNMCVQDIQQGKGVCYIDPHGDDVDHILSCVPKSRAEDVVYFDPADLDRPFGLNMLEYNPEYPEQKTFAVNELLKIFDRLYDLKATGGPMFEYYMRNALLLIMDSPETGSTLLEVPKVFSDDDFRNMKLKLCKTQVVKDFWLNEALKAGGESSLANMVPYITSKLTPFITNDYVRPIVGQQKSSFNIRDVMDTNKILLLKLSKGRIGDINAYLLGMVLVGKILMSAMSRVDQSKEDRQDFFLYIDEFQNFLTDSINAILSEARKYGLSLNIAHQFLGQLNQKGDTSIRDAIFGNVGSLAIFRIGSDDAKEFEKEFTPTFGEYDLINVPAYQAFVKLLIDGTASKPFNMRTYPPPDGNKKLGDLIKQLSTLTYGRDRKIVEEEIRIRATTQKQE